MKSLKIWILVILFSVSSLGYAFDGERLSIEDKQKIEELLDYIKSSPCTFIRNGSKHSAWRAYRHIKHKYKLFSGKIYDVHTFIKYAATRSERTGKDYKVSCPGEYLITNREWLYTVLEGLKKEIPND